MSENQDPLYVSAVTQLIEDGLVEIGEDGNARLTEKGTRYTGSRLDRLPPGDKIMLDIAFCESHDIPVSLF